MSSVAVKRAAPKAGALVEPAHGKYVYLYHNINTGQVVHSLSRTIRNNDAIRQIPFTGKKSVPSHIRKDIWNPLCSVVFPSVPQGLMAYKQLREFQKRHLLEWQPKKSNMSKREKMRHLMDQRPNCVADLAAVLAAQDETAVSLAEAAERLGASDQLHIQELEALMRNGKKNEERGQEVAGKLEAARQAQSIPEQMERLNQAIQRRDQDRIGAKKKRMLAEHQLGVVHTELSRLSMKEKAVPSKQRKKLVDGLESGSGKKDGQDWEYHPDIQAYYDYKNNDYANAQLAVTMAEEELEQTQQDIEKLSTRLADVNRAYLNLRRKAGLSVRAPGLARYAYEIPKDIEGTKWSKGYQPRKHEVPTVNMAGVKVNWATLEDAEFAESWPISVIHDKLAHVERYSAPDAADSIVPLESEASMKLATEAKPAEDTAATTKTEKEQVKGNSPADTSEDFDLEAILSKTDDLVANLPPSTRTLKDMRVQRRQNVKRAKAEWTASRNEQGLSTDIRAWREENRKRIEGRKKQMGQQPTLGGAGGEMPLSNAYD